MSMGLFSLAALFLIFNNLVMIPTCDFIYIYPAWGLLSFLNLWVGFFHQILKHFDHNFFAPNSHLILGIQVHVCWIACHCFTDQQGSDVFYLLCFFLTFFSISVWIEFRIPDLCFHSAQCAIKPIWWSFFFFFSFFPFQILYFSDLEFPFISFFIVSVSLCWYSPPSHSLYTS